MCQCPSAYMVRQKQLWIEVNVFKSVLMHFFTLAGLGLDLFVLCTKKINLFYAIFTDSSSL